MGTASNNSETLFEQEQKWCELVDSWQRQVIGDSDYGYLEPEFTNSVFAAFQYESGHYGYSRRKHSRLCRLYDLDYNNACLIRYTVRQYDFADGPSSDIHHFVGAGLQERGYRYLGTTSDDEIGTHLTYWYLKEFCHPVELPTDEDEDIDEDWDDEMEWFDDEYDY